jgi:uncharacterized membrane protein
LRSSITTSQSLKPQATRRYTAFRAQLATSLQYLATYHKDGHATGSLPKAANQSGETVGRTLGEEAMLWTITIILFVLWLVGMVSSYTLGGWIHILLVLAVIVLIFNLLSGRRAV